MKTQTYKMNLPNLLLPNLPDFLSKIYLNILYFNTLQSLNLSL